MTPRFAAAKVLQCVLAEGQSLSAALPVYQLKVANPADRGLVHELCAGVLRYHLRLQALTQLLLRKPLKAKDGDIQVLLLMGLYQLLYMRVPPHAAINETVSVAKKLKKAWAVGLVNGSLRSFQRSSETLLTKVDCDESAATAHPRWLLQTLQQAWPAQWREITTANNQKPPMTLRVNARSCSRDDYLQQLSAAGLDALPVTGAPQAITLLQPLEVERLPGFRDGWVSVQDSAAQLAAALLDLQPGQRVLDACSAPGGKACHLLELQRDIRLTAVEMDAARMERVTENLERLQLQAECIVADATQPEMWWDGVPYERILLDAPCSGSGVIRRHPDIKQLRRAADIPALAEQQRAILDALWPLLSTGGMLLYATCSVLPRENSEQIEHFLGTHDDAQVRLIEADWGRTAGAGRQILPGEHAMDGFFYACLVKSAR
ncbi:MAG: 16S rRNA (cytosine(967)-C(5))-methyltransferase RsmB [Gammaproteobacteria bacterium]|nr:16S rRNA (cytosine(967)-C(5))-methyltransferase RsmB [Gammaproteobacteria bacterium]